MAWSIEERREWLFPPVSGEIDGIDLAYLNPGNPDDRTLLIAFDHPEFEEAGDGEEIIVDGEPMNPRMHLTLHELVANQIWDGEPEETWTTAERLTGLGYERHEVLHMIARVVSDQLFEMLTDKRPYDAEQHTRGLAGLPDSWETERDRISRDRSPKRRRHRR